MTSPDRDREQTRRGLVYLACPYSDPDAAVREARFQEVNRVAAALMRDGLYVFSPISHTHPIALAGGLPLGWDFWQGYGRAILAACESLLVLTLDGWRESVGVQAEIGIARELGIPVKEVVPAHEVAAQEAQPLASSTDRAPAPGGLLACPFCGLEPWIPPADAPVLHGWYVECLQTCGTLGPTASTRDEAIAAWNNRAPVALAAPQEGV